MAGTEVLRGDRLHDRIVGVATDLFNTHGIRAVSADRILAEVGCSKVSFYRHFASKDDLVVAVLEQELAFVAALVTELGVADPAALMSQQLCRPGFRGCPFINAAAEYPDPTHPVREVVTRFRSLMTASFEAALEMRGVEHAKAAAQALMMLRDGALVSGYLDSDADSIAKVFGDAVERLTRA